MARFAEEIDLRRIAKNLNETLLSFEELKNAFKEGHFVVSDITPLSFAYPVRYADGLLIKHYTKNHTELLDMCTLLCNELDDKIYLANVEKKNYESFLKLGFCERYEVLKLYKLLLDVEKNTYPYKFLDYSPKYSNELNKIHKKVLGFSLVEDSDIISSNDNKLYTRLCFKDNKCIGYYSFKINFSALYGYLIKIILDDNFNRDEALDAITCDISTFLIKKGITFVFLDCNSLDDFDFFKEVGFRIYNQSYIMIK